MPKAGIAFLLLPCLAVVTQGLVGFLLWDGLAQPLWLGLAVVASLIAAAEVILPKTADRVKWLLTISCLSVSGVVGAAILAREDDTFLWLGVLNGALFAVLPVTIYISTRGVLVEVGPYELSIRYALSIRHVPFAEIVRVRRVSPRFPIAANMRPTVSVETRAAGLRRLFRRHIILLNIPPTEVDAFIAAVKAQSSS